jgi:hypothetical protein
MLEYLKAGPYAESQVQALELWALSTSMVRYRGTLQAYDEDVTQPSLIQTARRHGYAAKDAVLVWYLDSRYKYPRSFHLRLVGFDSALSRWTSLASLDGTGSGPLIDAK